MKYQRLFKRFFKQKRLSRLRRNITCIFTVRRLTRVGANRTDRRMLPGFAEKLHIGIQNHRATGAQKCRYSVTFGGIIICAVS